MNFPLRFERLPRRCWLRPRSLRKLRRRSPRVFRTCFTARSDMGVTFHEPNRVHSMPALGRRTSTIDPNPKAARSRLHRTTSGASGGFPLLPSGHLPLSIGGALWEGGHRTAEATTSEGPAAEGAQLRRGPVQLIRRWG